jgi:hypothetical protein
MSNFFEKVANDVTNVEQEFLGPDYKYYRFIRNPQQLGISGDGSIGALTDDIAGIIDYVELLVSGHGPASTTGKPLGDKFFLQTGGQCKDVKTGKLVTRSMYLNNVPSGEVNFIPAMPAMNIGGLFQGIIPGILNDIGDINPLSMFSAFMEGNEPPCAEVSLETIDENNNVSYKSGFVPINELQQLQAGGNIPDNTVTSEMLSEMKASSSTKESFVDMCTGKANKGISVKEEDTYQKYYIAAFSLLLVYIMYRMTRK